MLAQDLSPADPLPSWLQNGPDPPLAAGGEVRCSGGRAAGQLFRQQEARCTTRGSADTSNPHKAFHCHNQSLALCRAHKQRPTLQGSVRPASQCRSHGACPLFTDSDTEARTNRNLSLTSLYLPHSPHFLVNTSRPRFNFQPSPYLHIWLYSLRFLLNAPFLKCPSQRRDFSWCLIHVGRGGEVWKSAVYTVSLGGVWN